MKSTYTTRCLHALQQRVCTVIRYSVNLFRFRDGNLLEDNDLKFRNHPEIDLSRNRSKRATNL